MIWFYNNSERKNMYRYYSNGEFQKRYNKPTTILWHINGKKKCEVYIKDSCTRILSWNKNGKLCSDILYDTNTGAIHERKCN